MKVLIIHPFPFSEYKGGVERHCKNLEEGLNGKEGIEAVQVNKHFFEFLGQPLPKIGVLKIIKKENPDIVHLHGPRPFATLSCIFAKILGRKTVLTYHAPLNPEGFFKKIIAFLDQNIARLIFDFCIFTSEENREKGKRLFPVKKTTIIPPFLQENFCLFEKRKEDCQKDLSLGKEKVVLFVGKLDSHHYYKGLDVLIRSALLLEDNIRVFVIGDGGERRKYEEIVSQEGLKEKFIFLGHIPEEKLMCYYKASDIFVLPSTSSSEGFGLVLLEAMAMGLPVITTDIVGSAKMIKENGAGIIVKHKDPEDLARVIKRVLKDNSLRDSLVVSGKEFSDNFRVSRSINKFIDVYRRLVKRA